MDEQSSHYEPRETTSQQQNFVNDLEKLCKKLSEGQAVRTFFSFFFFNFFSCFSLVSCLIYRSNANFILENVKRLICIRTWMNRRTLWYVMRNRIVWSRSHVQGKHQIWVMNKLTGGRGSSTMIRVSFWEMLSWIRSMGLMNILCFDIPTSCNTWW